MRVTVSQIRDMKLKGEKIAMLTAYDYVTAKLVDESGIPLILVGDSLGMVVLGYESTIPVTMNEMVHHTKAVGKSAEAAKKLLKDAKSLEEAGAFAVVLEAVPAPLSKIITERLTVPTIGIGAGINCDGQVQVISDILGAFTDFVPRHAKRYAALAETIRNVATRYAAKAKSGAFPTEHQSYTMDESLLSGL